MRTRTFFGAGAVATLAMMASPSALALTVDYSSSIQSLGGPNVVCTSGGSLSECNLFYSSTPSPPVINPLPGFALGGYNRVDLLVHASDGPFSTRSAGIVEFGVLYGGSLLKLRTESLGQFFSQGCDSTNCYSASAWVLGTQTQVQMTEQIHALIPESLDGANVNARLTLPVTAFGYGSSSGVVFARLDGPSGGISQNLTFGSPNVDGGRYDVNQSLVLDIPIRAATDTSRDILLDFALQTDFRSSTTNGNGLLDASNSIGLNIVSADGVVFRSVSGDLDPFLTSAVPEPTTVALMLAGLVPMVMILRRRVRQRQAQ